MPFHPKLAVLLGSTLFSTVALAQNPPAAGVDLFKQNCVMCHGEDGKGSSIGKSLNVKDLTSGEVQSMKDDEIKTTIQKGNNNMPPFGTKFNDDQLNQLIAVIRSFKPKN